MLRTHTHTRVLFPLREYIPGARASWALVSEETWRCNNRRRHPSPATTLYTVLFRKGKLRHAPAKTWRGLRIPFSFSFVPFSSPLSTPPIPRFPSSRENENPENDGVSVSRRERQSFEVRVIPSLFFSPSPPPPSLAKHEFVQSGSLIPVFAFIRTINARDTRT